MDKTHIIKICEEFGMRVCLFLKRGKIFSGEIQDFGNTSLILKDRYGKNVPIDYEEIGYIDREDKERYNRDKNGKRKDQDN